MYESLFHYEAAGDFLLSMKRTKHVLFCCFFDVFEMCTGISNVRVKWDIFVPDGPVVGWPTGPAEGQWGRGERCEAIC